MEPQGEAPAEEEVEVPQTPRVDMSPERIGELQWIFDPNRPRDISQGTCRSQSWKSSTSAEERVRQVFSLFDTEKDGVIDVLEFWEMCVGLGKPIEIDMAAEALRKLDVNCDGVVDIEEFSAWWVPFEARMLERMQQQQEAAEAEAAEGEAQQEGEVQPEETEGSATGSAPVSSDPSPEKVERASVRASQREQPRESKRVEQPEPPFLKARASVAQGDVRASTSAPSSLVNLAQLDKIPSSTSSPPLSPQSSPDLAPQKIEKEDSIDRVRIEDQFAYIHRQSRLPPEFFEKYAPELSNDTPSPSPSPLPPSPIAVASSLYASSPTLSTSTRKYFQSKPLPSPPMKRSDRKVPNTEDSMALILPNFAARSTVESTELYPPAALPRTSGRAAPSHTAPEPIRRGAIPPIEMPQQQNNSVPSPSLLRKLSRAISPRKRRSSGAQSSGPESPRSASGSSPRSATSPRTPRSATSPRSYTLTRSPRSPRPASPARCVAVHGVAETFDWELEHVLKGGHLTRSFLNLCSRCGYLMKLGSGWQRRWAVLRSHVLFYFGSKDDLKPRGLLILTDAEVTVVDEVRFRFLLTAPVAYTGSQRFEKRIYTFGAGSRDDMLEWVGVLRLAAALVVPVTGKAL